MLFRSRNFSSQAKSSRVSRIYMPVMLLHTMASWSNLFKAKSSVSTICIYILSSTTATATGTITKSQPTIAFASGYNPSKTDGQTVPDPAADDLTIPGAGYATNSCTPSGSASRRPALILISLIGTSIFSPPWPPACYLPDGTPGATVAYGVRSFIRPSGGKGRAGPGCVLIL